MQYSSAILFGLLSCVLGKWQPVDEASLRKALEANDQTLIACELTMPLNTSVCQTLTDLHSRYSGVFC